MTAYLTTVIITAIASVTTAAITVYQLVRLILRQIKLAHSINLVELKARKIVYWIFAGVVGFLIFYLVMQMADAEAPGVVKFMEQFGVSRTLTNVAFMFPLIAMICAEAFIVMLGLGKNAVVDKGVFTNYAMLDWHQVRDYIIDEERGVVVLSSDKSTFSSLKGLTTPFRVSKKDVEKIKFILNKNKNKFSGFGGKDTDATF